MFSEYNSSIARPISMKPANRRSVLNFRILNLSLSQYSWLFLLCIVGNFGQVTESVAAELAAPTPKPHTEKAPPLRYLAKVGPETISLEEFSDKLKSGMREKYFHGKIPDKELVQFRRDLARQMVDRILYAQEAKRRNLLPDQAEVEKRIKALERKKKKDTYWQEHKDQILKSIRKEYEVDSLAAQLEAIFRKNIEPASAEVQTFYKTNEDKFTAPERVKVHIILMKVDPSSPSEEWDRINKFALDLVKKIRAGASFDELARIHSGDDSAAAGGDMGYIHKGMMGDNAASVLEAMKIGDLSEPVYLLEGIAIFRLDDREKARVNELPRVETSAKELLRKDMADKAWNDYTQSLRKQTEIVMNESVL